jgi:hypothetical protein
MPSAWYLLFRRSVLMFYTTKLVLFIFIRNRLCKAAWDPIIIFKGFIAPVNVRLTCTCKLQNCSLITTNLQQYPNNYIDDCDSAKLRQ